MQKNLAGLKKHWRAYAPLSCLKLLCQLEAEFPKLQAHNWGHDHSRSVGGFSKRFYLFPPGHAENLFELHKLALHKKAFLGGCIAREEEITELKTAFADLNKCSGKVDEEYMHHAIALANALGWTLDSKGYCLQANYQHHVFPPHTDERTVLMPSLKGGDGFGQQIGILQLRGEGSTMYVGFQDPVTLKASGVKFVMQSGDACSFEGNVRNNCVRAVVTAVPQPISEHTTSCTACNATIILRNGFDCVA